MITASTQTGKYQGGGNYPGNLSNDGFAVAGDSEIYVTIDDAIIVLGLDGKFLRKLDVPGAVQLNYYAGSLYFRSGDDIVRMNPETGESDTLLSVPGEKLYIDSERLYYNDATDSLTLHSATLEGKDRIKVDNVDKAYYRQLFSGWQVYAQSDDYELTLANLETGETFRPGYRGESWHTVWNNQLFYKRSGTELHQINLSSLSDDELAQLDEIAKKIAPD